MTHSRLAACLGVCALWILFASAEILLGTAQVSEHLLLSPALAQDSSAGISTTSDVAEKDPQIAKKFEKSGSDSPEDSDDEKGFYTPGQPKKPTKQIQEEPAPEEEDDAELKAPPATVHHGKNPQDGKSDAPGLVKVSHDTLMDEILRRLDSPDERTRLEATLALRKNAAQSDVEDLAKRLKQGNNRDKQLAIIEALGLLQDKRAGDALRFEVDHGDEYTRRAAVTALGNLNFNWPVPVLAKVLRKEKSEELRKRAASALGQIGSPQAIYTLRTTLSMLDEAPGAKNAAYWALEKARGEIDDEQIDTDMPRGRRLQLYYNGTRYYFYHPANRREAGIEKSGLRPWLLVCIHDSDLRAEEVFNICYRSAKKEGLAVLVPVIDNMRYPDYGNFNMRGERFDKRLLELVEHVGQHAGLTVREFFMFGYGMGGDFVQKFAMVYPKRIAKAAYECSNYTTPDAEAYFPRGLNRSPLAPDVQINMYDVMKTDQLLILRKNSETLRQGKEYFESMEHYSQINGIRERLNVRTVDVKFEIWNEAEKYLLSTD
ncbi:MAG: HEAT repeat domain-containing protein [Bdellovibrionota bacterium]